MVEIGGIGPATHLVYAQSQDTNAPDRIRYFGDKLKTARILDQHPDDSRWYR